MQPLLIRIRKHRVHMTLGRIGAALAGVTVVLGTATAVASARVMPPSMVIWGMTRKPFLAIPLVSVWLFAGFVAAGVYWRRRPDIHRPMMLLGTLSAMTAAVSRIDALNHLSTGTWWEAAFGPFLFTIVLGVLLLAIRCVLLRSLDRWFAVAVAVQAFVLLLFLHVARTAAWDSFASLLVP